MHCWNDAPDARIQAIASDSSAAVEDPARGSPRLPALCAQEPCVGPKQGRVTFLSSVVPGTGLCMGLAVHCYLLAGVNVSPLCSGSPIWKDGNISAEGPRWQQRRQQHPAGGHGCRIHASPRWVRGLKGLPASFHLQCRQLRTVGNPAPCLQASLSFIWVSHMSPWPPGQLTSP